MPAGAYRGNLSGIAHPGGVGYKHAMQLHALLLLLCAGVAAAQIDLPSRQSDASGGVRIAEQIADLDLAGREQLILAQISAGNVPESWKRFVPVKVTRIIDGEQFNAELLVAPDYLAVGSDEDRLLTPLSPRSAQEIADRLGCVIPTRQMVDDIYNAASLKLEPAPIPPSPDMVKVKTWLQHQETIQKQRKETKSPPGLIAGHKKDVVVTNQLNAAPGKVAIYGWHRLDGTPIQPLYLGHTELWVDYSHGIRLVARSMTVNGKSTTVEEVLADRKLSGLLSDEGVILNPRYPTPERGSAVSSAEKSETLVFEPGVRVILNFPASDDATKPLRLILYALPSGNSIEQTIGRRINPGDDWHFDIQHIGAQTRWLRKREPDVSLAVAYLECEGKSWPAWRKKYDPNDERISQIVDALRRRFTGRKFTLVLTGHSGGGSFTFGYLNGIEAIPDDVERIGFLDSNYAYDSSKAHGDKLAAWLANSKQRYLTVIAYEDYIALLNGNTFVSENGGTWGRSRLMLADLKNKIDFTGDTDTEWERYTALEGRVKFLMRKNPAKAVLHTRLVELNGFIHAMLTGTALENRDYTFFGSRAYEEFVAP
jgi:hypothetical protein